MLFGTEEIWTTEVHAKDGVGFGAEIAFFG